MVEKQEIVRHFCHSARRTIKIYNQQNEPTNERIANNGKGTGNGKEREERGKEWVTKTRNHTERQMSREGRRETGDGKGRPKKNSINCHAVKCSFVWWRKKGQKRKQDRREERKEGRGDGGKRGGDQQGTRLCFS